MSSTVRVCSGIILLYHRVADVTRDPFGLCVRPTIFRQQMEYIKRTCAPLPLAEFAAALVNNSLPQRAVAITFDDGYVDNLLTASPILERLNLPATFYVTTDRLDEPHEFWWDVLVDSVGCDDAAIRLEHERAMKGSILQRDEHMHRWFHGRPPVTNETHLRPMTGNEIDLLAARRQHEVGAHTVNHLFLPAQTTKICHAELHDCKRVLEDRLGRSVPSVAYPFGAVTPAISKMAGVMGYSIGVTVDARAVSQDDDLLALPRVPIHGGVRDFSAHIETLFSASGRRE